MFGEVIERGSPALSKEMGELSAEHAQLLVYSWAGGGSRKNKPTLPNQVTTSRQGPLSLNSYTSTSHAAHKCSPSPRTQVKSALRGESSPQPLTSSHHPMGSPHCHVSRLPAPHHHHHHPSRSLTCRRLLNTLPVVTQRPLELVEQELEEGNLTCAQLRQTVMQVCV